jgi:hypothetical protein
MKKPKVILDSGAYTAHRKGKKIDIDDYAEYVKEHGNEYDMCFNLDSIGNAKKSYTNWKYLQSKGVDTVPIYHIGTNEVFLRKYLRETDYIGLGAIANLETTQRLLGLSHIWKTYLTNKEGIPTVKVHGLGLTAVDIMIRYPWYSVDSFTPVISAVWGSVLLPRLDNDGTPHYFKLGISKISDQGDHKVDMANSFPSLPERSKGVYYKLFEKYGFKIGEIAYQVKKDRRGKQGENERKPVPMFDLIKPANIKTRTLANSWEERMRWNLTMWTHLRKRLPIYPRPFVDKNDAYEEEINNHPKTIMYMGVSTTTHLNIFNMISPKLDILISYAYLTDPINKLIKEYIK